MSKPNSLTTMLRRSLAAMIDPHPPAGLAWCVGCQFRDDGRTVVLTSDEIFDHVKLHQNDKHMVKVSMVQKKVPPKAHAGE